MHEDLKDPKKHLTRIEKKKPTKDRVTEIMKTWSATPKTYVLAIP